MTKTCPECKTLNLDNADFCQKCGSELLGKTSNGGSMGWWNQQSTGAKAVIGIVGLCCLGLIVIVGMFGMLSPDKTTNSSKEPFEAYGTDTGTYYSSEFLSFSHNPFKTITHSNKLNNVSDLVSADFENGDGVLVQKPVATTQSAYDAAVESKDLTNNERFKDSGMSSNANIESIQIAGVTGYKVDSLNYNNGELMSHSINVFFVKDGKLYQITFTSVGKDTINQNKENMDKILNSITVT